METRTVQVNRDRQIPSFFFDDPVLVIARFALVCSEYGVHRHCIQNEMLIFTSILL